MNIYYDFGADGFEYEVDLYDYVESHYSLEDILNLYVNEIYNEDEEVRKDFQRELGINTEQEFRDYVHYMGDVSWMIEELIDKLGEDYFDNDELHDYYADEAREEYQDLKDAEDEREYNSWKSHFW